MDNPYYERLVNSAIRFVSYRPRSQKELRDFLAKKLTKWKVSGAGLLEKVVARTGELGYVDDEKFAAWWVEQRTAFKQKGNRLIELELRQKGVAREVIVSVLEGRDMLAPARKAIQNKRFKNEKQLYDYLARRGFDADTIKRVQ